METGKATITFIDRGFLCDVEDIKIDLPKAEITGADVVACWKSLCDPGICVEAAIPIHPFAVEWLRKWWVGFRNSRMLMRRANRRRVRRQRALIRRR